MIWRQGGHEYPLCLSIFTIIQMKLTNQASTRATRHEAKNAFLASAKIESQDILPKVEVAPFDINAQDPIVSAFE